MGLYVCMYVCMYYGTALQHFRGRQRHAQKELQEVVVLETQGPRPTSRTRLKTSLRWPPSEPPFNHCSLPHFNSSASKFFFKSFLSSPIDRLAASPGEYKHEPV